MMAEASTPWAGTVTGDAGPYSDETWSDIWRILFIIDRTTQGYIRAHENELVVSGTSSPISVATGAGLVDGKFYENDSPLGVAVPTPAGATRIDRIVLRKSWSAQTVRVTRIAGSEGGGAPVLVQTDGVTWDIPLAQASITTGGVITVSDQRVPTLAPIGGIPGTQAGQIPYVSAPNQIDLLDATTVGAILQLNPSLLPSWFAMGTALQTLRVNAAGTAFEWVNAPQIEHANVGTDSGTRTSTSFGDPSGVTGPSVDIVAPPSGKILVYWDGQFSISTSAEAWRTAISVDGAAPSGTVYNELQGANTIVYVTTSKQRLFTGLTPGQSYNFKVLCAVTGGTGTFRRYGIMAQTK